MSEIQIVYRFKNGVRNTDCWQKTVKKQSEKQRAARARSNATHTTDTDGARGGVEGGGARGEKILRKQIRLQARRLSFRAWVLEWRDSKPSGHDL